MPQERWRTANGDKDAGRFTPPQVFDQDEESDERMTVTKAVGVVVTLLFGIVGTLGFVSFFVYHALQALGVSVSWIDAFIVSGSFIVLRYFDLGISSRLRKNEG